MEPKYVIILVFVVCLVAVLLFPKSCESTFSSFLDPQSSEDWQNCKCIGFKLDVGPLTTGIDGPDIRCAGIPIKLPYTNETSGE